MSKWTVIRGNEHNKSSKKAADASLKKVVSKDYAGLKKEGNKAFDEKVAREDSLVAAFDEKKLKSKALIKEAKNIKKLRQKAAEKQAAKEAKKDKAAE